MDLHLDSIVRPGGLRALANLFLPGASDEPRQPRGKRLLLPLLAVALTGLAAMSVAFARGHRVMGTTSEIPWGVLIATYVFLVVSSTGLGLVSALGHVFGYEVFEPIAKKAMWLALITLVVGFSVIASELERPLVLLRMVLVSPNPHSPIWWMGTLYGLYLVVIAGELYFLLADNHRWSRIGGVVTVMAALTVHPTSNLGAVFGLSHARTFWYGPFLPVYMMATALVCGAALLLLVVYLGDRFGPRGELHAEHAPLVEALRKLLSLFIGIMVMLEVWRFVAGVQGGHYHKFDATMAFLSGPLFVSFWVCEVFVGVVLPLAILLRIGVGEWARAPGYVALAAVFTLVGVFVQRLNMVYAGQMFSLKPVVGRAGEKLVYSPPFKGNPTGFLPYTPSLVEVLIVAGAISAAALLFIAGTRVLRLEPERQSDAHRAAPPLPSEVAHG